MRGEIFVLLICVLIIAWCLYQYNYFNGEKFKSIKDRIKKYVANCNALNEHIVELRSTHIGIDQLDYGNGTYADTSIYNYRRPEWKNILREPYVYQCSRTVCDNARKQPYKYICKYFNVKPTEESLEKFENLLNNFEAAEQGKTVLKKEKNRIYSSIGKDVPFLIRKLCPNKLEKALGFEKFDFNTVYFPEYIFSYVSSGGYASTQFRIVMNIDNLNRFIKYLSETIKFKKSVAGQRALMTSGLRYSILKRDNYECRICGLSNRKEPNLLLEVDHIIPLSKGGTTTESNLQTLCWKCNRRKGAKIYNYYQVIGEQDDSISFQGNAKKKCIHCGSEDIDAEGYCNECGMKVL